MKPHSAVRGGASRVCTFRPVCAVVGGIVGGVIGGLIGHYAGESAGDWLNDKGVDRVAVSME